MPSALAQVTRRYVDGAHGQMHLRQAGRLTERPTLLCLHMSPYSGRLYEPFLPVMGSDRWAIAPDTPGFGMSDAPDEPPEIADYAQAISDLIDALGLKTPVDVMGYHTGAMTAPELAILRPDRIRRVIMVSAPVYTDEERANARRTYAHREPEADGSHLVEQWKAGLFWNLHGAATLQTVADEFPEKLMGRAKAAWGHRAAFNHVLEARLPLVEQPVLVLNPKDDLWTRTPRVVPALRHGQVRDMPGWGHGFLRHHTAETADMIRSFLDAPDADPFGSIRMPADAMVDRPLPTR